MTTVYDLKPNQIVRLRMTDGEVIRAAVVVPPVAWLLDTMLVVLDEPPRRPTAEINPKDVAEILEVSDPVLTKLPPA